MFSVFFIFTFIIILINLLLILRAYAKHKPDEIISDEKPHVTIIIPAYNERKVIEETIRMLFLQTYEDYKIIVVDDGSTDSTAEFLIDKFNLTERPYEGGVWDNGKLYLFTGHENKGKAESLNRGVWYAENEFKAEWVLTVDADTLVDTNCLEEMMQKKREDADAVTCMIGIANGNRNLYKTSIPLGILPRIQWLDYLRTYVIFRNSMKDLDTIVIMPGSCSLLRVATIYEVGGWTSRTLTEDMELTLQLQRHGKKIQYLSEILGWTQCPTNLGDTGKQRVRWKIGMLQTIKLFPMLWFQKSNKPLTYFMMPYLWASELISPLLETTCVTLMGLGIVGVINVPLEEILSIWAMIALSYMILTMAVVGFVNKKLVLPNGPVRLDRLIIISIVEGFTYHFIFLFWHMKAIFLWVRGGNKWNKVGRSSHRQA